MKLSELTNEQLRVIAEHYPEWLAKHRYLPNYAEPDVPDEIEKLLKEAPQMTREKLKALIDEQANDVWLWLIAETVTEAYLQRELRKLHDAIEKLLMEVEE
jgi:hypothetical protein